jgi:hypothetical protein
VRTSDLHIEHYLLSHRFRLAFAGRMDFPINDASVTASEYVWVLLNLLRAMRMAVTILFATMS